MNKYKKDFPIFKQKNGQKLVYLDSAATSQKPQVVIDAVREFYEEYNSNIHRGIYHIAEKATASVERVRGKIAKFINASDPSEIVFTHGTTEGINILARDFQNSFDEYSEVIVSEMEHHSNFVPWHVLATKKKSKLLFLTIDENGELTNKIADKNGTIIYDSDFSNMHHFSGLSLTHVSNVLGTINPIKEIIKKFENEVYSITDSIIVDAAQSVPHMKVDVQDLGCSFLVFSGHKMFSPSGVGVLWGKQNLLNNLDPLLYGSQMIREVSSKEVTFQKAPGLFEPGTLPLEGIIGLGAAVDYLSSVGMDTINTHVRELTSFAMEKLRRIPGVTVYGPENPLHRVGIVSFTVDQIHPHDIAQIFAENNICVRAGHHCAMPLHKKLGVPATVRASFHIYNDEEDVDALIHGIEDAKKVFSIQ